MSLSETLWIVILAGVGLSVSLAAAGFVWRARAQQAGASSPTLLPVNQEPVTALDSVEKQEPDKTAIRCAA